MDIGFFLISLGKSEYGRFVIQIAYKGDTGFGSAFPKPIWDNYCRVPCQIGHQKLVAAKTGTNQHIYLLHKGMDFLN